MKKLVNLFFICLGFCGRSQTICFGETATLLAGNPNGLTQASYSLNPGALQNQTGTFVVSPSVTTSYTLYTSGYNTNLQFTTTSAVNEVTVFAVPQVSPLVLHPTCTNSLGGFDLQLAFQPASPVPGYTITWLGIPNNVVTPQQTMASGVYAGPYTATITAAGGCSVEAHFTVNPTPATAVFTHSPPGDTLKLTCLNPTLLIAGSEPSYTYLWNSLSTGPLAGSVITMQSQHVGSWTVTGTTPQGICSATHTFYLVLDQQAPVANASPSVQTISCLQSGLITVTLQASPAANNVHTVHDQMGGIFSAGGGLAIYKPGSVGVFTHCAVNLVNGCKSCGQFTITSNQGFPTFNLLSPDNFTLGCSTKSVATINISNASTTGTNQAPNFGPVSFTLMPPGSPGIAGGTLSSISTYTVNQPGTYTVVVQDLNNSCRTKLPVTILQNDAGPKLTVQVPLEVLDCTYSTTILKASSTNPEVDFNWGFLGTAGNVASPSLAVYVDLNAPSKTVINDYTLTITDRSNLCKSFSVVTILQNVFPPKTGFSISAASISCGYPLIVMTNSSVTGIPPGMYPVLHPVAGWLWQGPSPQKPLQLSTTYVGAMPGTYTLTGKDPNNGCVSEATMSVGDSRKYPLLNIPAAPAPSMLECGADYATLSPIITTSSSALQYTWTGPPTATIGGKHTATLMTNQVGIYTITVTDLNNACTSAATMNVITGSITADFDADRPQGVVPHTVMFYNNSSYTRAKNVGAEGITSVWSFGNGTTASGVLNTERPTVVYHAAGVYTITLYVSKGNCLASAQRTVTVELPSSLNVPNVFTPNGDGINDEFFLRADRIQELTVFIYDRWGKLVYSLRSKAGNFVWDGKDLAGNDVADGVFYYTISAIGAEGNLIDEKGTITLLR